MLRIDTHAHIFPELSQKPLGARYAPSYSASLETFFKHLTTSQIQRAVLIQPSFLGNDNTLLLAALKAHPDRLRGVAALNIHQTNLDTLTDAYCTGVRGIRLNLLGTPLDALEPLLSRLIQQLTQFSKLHLEIHAQGEQWLICASLLKHLPFPVVIDHYGRPDPNPCPGLLALGQVASSTRLFVKLSAPYRLEVPLYELNQLTHYWLNTVGKDHLLWGSDWPHTQHENRPELQTYQAVMLAAMAHFEQAGLDINSLNTNALSLYFRT